MTELTPMPTQDDVLPLAKRVYYGLYSTDAEIDTAELQRIVDWLREGYLTQDDIASADVYALIEEWQETEEA